MNPHSLYFHIPFCVHRCAYCDFNTYAGQEAHLPAYVAALRNEILSVGESARAALGSRLPARTVFFGGGTPSLLSPAQFAPVLQSIRDSFALEDEAEISLEANPGTVTLDDLRGLRQVGFNRLSLGVQSSHPEELRQLERIHDFYDVIEAVGWARQAGFDNLNLDLIYGLPEQSLDRWSATVKRAVALSPEHLSLYALTIEHGTPFGRWVGGGRMPAPDPDAAADMYEWAGEYLEANGYHQYEISNWARPGGECRHNLTYWRNLPYLGFGAGAHGSAGGLRVANVLRIQTYLERLANTPAAVKFPLSPATVDQQSISSWVEMQETMMLGLRLTDEGVSGLAFQERFGRELVDVFAKELDELVRLGLLEWEGPVVRLTRHGRLLGNQAFLHFVG
jgi:oxygen-independent coproporphyrinogen-3 oxidase